MTRLAAALNSDDLTHHETHCDVDVLQAAGLTAVHKALGVLIVEAKEGCAGESMDSVSRIRELERAMEPQVKRIARRWGIRVEVEAVSSQIVRELVLDRCHVCQGRGHIPMKYDGTRLVAVVEDDGPTKEVDCSYCFGSGAARRDYHGRARAAGFEEYTKRLGEWWEAVLQSCCDAEISARAGMAKRLHNKPLYAEPK
jgi:hypothetical protein